MAVADDYELVLRTFFKYPSVYIRDIGYLQYRNEEGNNFTFLRNSLIQRKTHITAKFYNEKIHDYLQKNNIVDHSYSNIVYKGPNYLIYDPDEHERIGYHFSPNKQDKEMYVSVIIPTCNNIAKLAKAIKSVFDQSYPYWNLYIVGNKCPKLDQYMEANIAMFSEICKTNKVMYWNFQDKPYGVYACKNYAIRNLIDEEWIAYLEDDFEWAPNHLQTMIDVVRTNPNANWVYSGMRIGDVPIICEKPTLFATETSCIMHHISLLQKYGYWKPADQVAHSDVWDLISNWPKHDCTTTSECTVLHSRDDELIQLISMTIKDLRMVQ
jgi:hypothetical protein